MSISGQDAVSAEVVGWRRDIHAHPELGFEEHRTSALVAQKLQSWGLEVHTGLAGTGVIGILQGSKPGSRAIGLRADMDALAMREENKFSHRSRNDGAMHACGHDGHTAMLLGAAQHLATERSFAGTVYFIFQPAEEGRGGADRMIAEGLFDRFPCDAVFGLHNWPGLRLGTIGMRTGPMMAAMDLLEIQVRGKGGHAGLPHLATDPVVIAAHIITALQSVVSRSTDPNDAAVVSVTCVRAGTAHNVIPSEVVMTGTVRTLRAATRDRVEALIRQIATSVAGAFGAEALVTYERKVLAVVNTEAETRQAALAAALAVGKENVDSNVSATMGSEDFASMLAVRPGTYVFLGQSDQEHPHSIHSPRYDFNDAALSIGMRYWINLVRVFFGSELDRVSSHPGVL